MNKLIIITIATLLLIFSGCSNSDLMIIENNNIDDTNITNTTTYSSFKIVELIGNGSSSNVNLSDYYNKTESDSLFLSSTYNSSLARTGNCSVGQVVMNITSTGVECVAIGGSSSNSSLEIKTYGIDPVINFTREYFFVRNSSPNISIIYTNTIPNSTSIIGTSINSYSIKTGVRTLWLCKNGTTYQFSTNSGITINSSTGLTFQYPLGYNESLCINGTLDAFNVRGLVKNFPNSSVFPIVNMNLSIGDNVIYTAPTGRRVGIYPTATVPNLEQSTLFYHVTNSTSRTYFVYIAKNGTTYTELDKIIGGTAATAQQITSITSNFILNEGDSIILNTNSTNGYFYAFGYYLT